MSSLIFCFWRATVLTFLKNGLKFVKDKALEIIPKYGRTVAKVGLRVAERIIIFEAFQLTCLIFQNVVCSVIRIGFNSYFFLRRHIFAIFMPTC